jgi:hypothetical protein
MHMGYVEGSIASVMICKNLCEDEDFETAEEAIRSLAKSWLLKYAYQEFPSQKKCCEKPQEQKEGANFCSNCGQSFKRTHTHFHYLMEHFSNWISEQGSLIMDEYGDSLLEFGPWNEFVTIKEVLQEPPSQIIEIADFAERIITLCLKGDEFDSEDCSFHWLSSELKSSVENYSRNNSWIYSNFGHSTLSELLESYRLS